VTSPPRRVTDQLCAVLGSLLDEHGQPVTRTARETAAAAGQRAQTTGDILARLVDDGHAETGLTEPGNRARLTARPVRTYTLTTTGTAYARTVLGRAGTTVSGDPTC
jgi:hypothetical protein